MEGILKKFKSLIKINLKLKINRFDCIDYSDEIQCPQLNCDSRSQFKCANGSCLPISWKCDSDVRKLN